jgi:prepilin-type N-terminal cleavage/methylation domain-containing protein
MAISFLKQYKKTERGFTMVEVLVAVTLFSIAVAGVITAAVQGGININYAKFRLTANYLAQEGIELMRAKRDSYVIDNSTDFETGWNTFATEALSNCTLAGPCDIDVTDVSTPVVGGTAPLGLRYVPCVAGCSITYESGVSGLGYYGHSSLGTPTPFTRRITVATFPSSPNELEITSTVTWLEGTNTQSVTISESLFNWY